MLTNIPTKSINLPDRILNVDTPKFPFSNGTERNYLKIGRTKTNASQGIHQSFYQVWIPGAFCALPPTHQSPGQYSSSLNNLLLYFAGLARGRDIKLPPGLSSRSLPASTKSARFPSCSGVKSCPKIRLRPSATYADMAPSTPSAPED